jgi:hypothetical protein
VSTHDEEQSGRNVAIMRSVYDRRTRSYLAPDVSVGWVGVGSGVARSVVGGQAASGGSGFVAGSEARTPLGSGSWADLCHFSRRGGGVEACAAGERGLAGPARPGDWRFRRPGRSRRAGCSPQGQISDRFGCITTHSRARKTRLGCSTAGGWGTTQTTKTSPRLGRSPGVLQSRDDLQAPVTPRSARSTSQRQLGQRAEADRQPRRSSLAGNHESRTGRPACPEVGRFSAPTSWPPSAAGGDCPGAPTTPHNTAPPREHREPPDAT